MCIHSLEVIGVLWEVKWGTATRSCRLNAFTVAATKKDSLEKAAPVVFYLSLPPSLTLSLSFCFCFCPFLISSLGTVGIAGDGKDCLLDYVLITVSTGVMTY